MKLLPDVRTVFLRYRNEALKALQNGDLGKCESILKRMEMLIDSYNGKS